MANIVKGKIGNALESVAPDGIVTTADAIYDETKGKSQEQINEDTKQSLAEQASNIGYYECGTAAATAAKEITGGSYKLPAAAPYGGTLKVKFTHKNSAANPTLSINQSTPKPLYYNGAIASSTNTWEDGDVLDLYYDGTNFNAKSVVEKFATGEKVKEVGIDSEPTAGSDNLVKSGGVADVFNKTNYEQNKTVDAISKKTSVNGFELGYYDTYSSSIPSTRTPVGAIWSVKINVTPGSFIKICGEGADNDAMRLYAFGDSNGNRIVGERFQGAGEFRNNPIYTTVPNNAVVMIINLYHYNEGTDGVWIIKEKIESDKLQYDIENVKNTLEVTNPIIEIGGIITDEQSLGLNIDNQKRARTQGFIKAPFFAEIKDGFNFFYLFKYPLDAVLNETLASSAINIEDSTSVDITDTSFKYRMSFKKIDSTEDISEEETKVLCDIYTLNDYTLKKEISELNPSSIGKFYLAKIRESFITDYSSLINAYDELAIQFPNLITKNNLGQTIDGSYIYEYIIGTETYNNAGVRGNRDALINKPVFAVLSGIHGYERCAINSLYLIIKDLLLGECNLSPLLQNVELHIIPCACPWGFTNNSRTNYNGVNINRNFDVNWVEYGEGTYDYSGPSAASELETQIIQEWVLSLKSKDVKFIFDWHNSGVINEIICFASGNNNIDGILDLKHHFLINSQNIDATLITHYGVPQNSVFSYTSVDNLGGMLSTYISLENLLGGYIETSWNADRKGENTPSSASIGASLMGNILVGYLKLYNISLL